MFKKKKDRNGVATPGGIRIGSTSSLDNASVAAVPKKQSTLLSFHSEADVEEQDDEIARLKAIREKEKVKLQEKEKKKKEERGTEKINRVKNNNIIISGDYESPSSSSSSSSMYSAEALAELRKQNQQQHLKTFDSASTDDPLSSSSTAATSDTTAAPVSVINNFAIELEDDDEARDIEEQLKEQKRVKEAKLQRASLAASSKQDKEFIPLHSSSYSSSSSSSRPQPQYRDRRRGEALTGARDNREILREEIRNQLELVDDSMDGQEEKIEAIVKQQHHGRRKNGEQDEKGERFVDLDEDEEMRRWETDQIRKGGAKIRVSAQPTSSFKSSSTAPSVPRPLPPLDTSTLTFSHFNSSLSSTLAFLRSTHSTTTSSLSILSSSLTSLTSTLTSLSSSLSHNQLAYDHYQDWKYQFKEMNEFLYEKSKLLKKWELKRKKEMKFRWVEWKKLINLNKEDELRDAEFKMWKKEKEKRVIEIDMDENEDEEDEEEEEEEDVEGKKEKHKKKGGEEEKVLLSAGTADDPVELDEFGRDMSLIRDQERIKRRRERQQRASARKEQFFRRSFPTSTSPLSSLSAGALFCSSADDGFESDLDYLPHSSSSSSSSSFSLTPFSSSSFCSDSLPHYSSVTFVSSLFQQWKSLYPDDYQKTFAGVILVRIVGLWVRVELMEWNVLEEVIEGETNGKQKEENGEEKEAVVSRKRIKSFTEMEWYKILYNYGVTSSSNESQLSTSSVTSSSSTSASTSTTSTSLKPSSSVPPSIVDPDLNLIPTLISTYVLPFLSFCFTTSYDASSLRSFSFFSHLIIDVIIHLYGIESEKLEKFLMEVIVKRLGMEVKELEKWPCKPEKETVDDANNERDVEMTSDSTSGLFKLSPQRQYCVARFNHSIKLLHIIVEWKRVFHEAFHRCDDTTAAAAVSTDSTSSLFSRLDVSLRSIASDLCSTSLLPIFLHQIRGAVAATSPSPPLPLSPLFETQSLGHLCRGLVATFPTNWIGDINKITDSSPAMARLYSLAARFAAMATAVIITSDMITVIAALHQLLS